MLVKIIFLENKVVINFNFKHGAKKSSHLDHAFTILLATSIGDRVTKCTTVLYSDWSLQMGQRGPKMTLGTLTMSGDVFPGV